MAAGAYSTPLRFPRPPANALVHWARGVEVDFRTARREDHLPFDVHSPSVFMLGGLCSPFHAAATKNQCEASEQCTSARQELRR